MKIIWMSWILVVFVAQLFVSAKGYYRSWVNDANKIIMLAMILMYTIIINICKLVFLATTCLHGIILIDRGNHIIAAISSLSLGWKRVMSISYIYFLIIYGLALYETYRLLLEILCLNSCPYYLGLTRIQTYIHSMNPICIEEPKKIQYSITMIKFW